MARGENEVARTRRKDAELKAAIGEDEREFADLRQRGAIISAVDRVWPNRRTTR